jgi:hypothetical protein
MREKEESLYKAKRAKRTAAPIEPHAVPVRDPAPVKVAGEVLDGETAMVAFETPTEVKVVAAGMAGVTPAAWVAGMVVAATSAAETVVDPCTVVNWT